MENKFTPTKRNYKKTSFVDLLELITPEVYIQEDGTLSGYQVNPVSEVINTHVRIGQNIDSVLSVSGVADTQTENIGNISGIAPYFVKQNDLTKITPYLFEKNILVPLGQSLVNFSNKEEFLTYLSGTLLPKIIVEQGTNPGTVRSNMDTLYVLADTQVSSVHNYLIDTLGWFYFLNTSADGGLSFDPSTYVASSLGRLFDGETLTILDGVLGLTEYIWKNYETCATFQNLGLIPTSFVSGAADAIVEASAGVTADYTSGTQKLDNLKTLVEVIYSQAYMDNEDYRVQEAFLDYINAETELNDRVSAGPLRAFFNAMGFSLADRTAEIENIQLLYDIENCPDDNLQRLADLIGWRLYGNSPSKWRHQLRSAVDVYKRKGTLDAIQYAINALIINTSFDVSSRVQELYESYLPQLIWYALGTESRHFKDLNTWTPNLAIDAGIYEYSTSSIEDNLRLAVDYILLELYDYFPDNFVFKGEKFPTYDFYILDENGELDEKYTTIYHPNTQPFYMLDPEDPTYDALYQAAIAVNETQRWDAATFDGPLGYGTYFAGTFNSDPTIRPTYLSATGDMSFVFNYRGRQNFPLPPFEEVKYYEDCLITAPLVERLVERLKCLGVGRSFGDQLKTFLLEAAVDTQDTLGDLNNFLMLFSATQVPPNFDYVLENIDQYYKNLIPLWNGKSSHLFIDFTADDFDFTKTTIEGDSRYAVIEASRIINEFSPAHAIPVVAVTTSATEDFNVSSTKFEYLGFDKQDSLVDQQGSLGNFETSGAAMSFTNGGGDGDLGSDDGRLGLNTFKREAVDSLYTDLNFSSTDAIITTPRRAHRRRSLKFALPRSGYYDRTGFNGPVSFDPSAYEGSFPSSMGALTLGYVASAGKFHPVDDPIDPTGVWNICENLSSTRSFSGVATNTTFPYRGLSSLGSNAKMPEVGATTARYVDRDQLPGIYRAMHSLFQKKAYDHANENATIDYTSKWKNILQSYANQAIADGYVLDSFDEYIKFAFGKGLHNAHRDYAKYFDKHPLGLNEIEKTGGNIFAHVFGKGLFNCDFSVEGSAVGDYINPELDTVNRINKNTIWKDGADGTYGFSAVGDMVVPLSGTFTADKDGNAEFRNRSILSGVEFVDASGNSDKNSFAVFKLDGSNAVAGGENYLVDNTVIKCKAFAGLPRIRFDLSAVGDRRNYFIKDHKFKLSINALVGEENSPNLGGGTIGVWIHTQTEQDYIWSWTTDGRWVPHRESDLSIDAVQNYSHFYSFDNFVPSPTTTTASAYDYCLETYIGKSSTDINDVTLTNIRKDFFSKFVVEFDTRNFTITNNKEYQKLIPMSDSLYQIFEQVHRDDTNYIVEIYFLKNKPEKYLLLENIELQDMTLRDEAAIPTGHGTETNGWPLRRFVHEDKLYLNKDELREVLKFYNGLAGLDTKYTSILNSRDYTLTENSLEVSGGSRLNYRTHPEWGTYTKDTTLQHYNYSLIEVDN